MKHHIRFRLAIGLGTFLDLSVLSRAYVRRAVPRSGFADNTAIALEHLTRLHYGDHGDDESHIRST